MNRQKSYIYINLQHVCLNYLWDFCFIKYFIIFLLHIQTNHYITIVWHWLFTFLSQSRYACWLSLYGLIWILGNTRKRIPVFFCYFFSIRFCRMRSTRTTSTATSHLLHTKISRENWNTPKTIWFFNRSGRWCVANNHQEQRRWRYTGNWEKASFIINGRASGVSFHPFTTDETPTDIIKNNSEIARTVTASNLIVEKKVNKIYNKLNLRKGGRTSVNIILPVGIGNKPQFFHIFNFIVTHVD